MKEQGLASCSKLLPLPILNPNGRSACEFLKKYTKPHILCYNDLSREYMLTIPMPVGCSSQHKETVASVQ